MSTKGPKAIKNEIWFGFSTTTEVVGSVYNEPEARVLITSSSLSTQSKSHTACIHPSIRVDSWRNPAEAHSPRPESIIFSSKIAAQKSSMESTKVIFHLTAAAAFLLLAALSSGGAMVQAVVSEPKRLIVGDDSGWRLGFDYAAWAAANPVRVSDILVFKYDNASHTVASLNTKEEFDSCDFTTPKKNRASGFSNVVMAEVGPRYYACSIGLHCQNGMKLMVDVQE
ncbi:hypothetical protein Mapa_004769 [Marchantia paleacea]|nr:hypothetical protein Mapa_004769 [Marchantia paleacea]